MQSTTLNKYQTTGCKVDNFVMDGLDQEPKSPMIMLILLKMEQSDNGSLILRYKRMFTEFWIISTENSWTWNELSCKVYLPVYGKYWGREELLGWYSEKVIIKIKTMLNSLRQIIKFIQQICIMRSKNKKGESSGVELIGLRAVIKCNERILWILIQTN